MPSDEESKDDQAPSNNNRRMSAFSDKGYRRMSMTGATIHDPVILELIEWGTSRSFEEELAEWMENHSSEFVDECGIDEEQPLTWGNAFREYIEWLDAKLGEFCSDLSVSSEEVAEKMAATIDKNKDEEFFPAFMNITEYDVFVAQMHELALKARREREATEAVEEAAEADDSGVMNISGIWEADPTKYDPESAEAALKHANCPWVFRKVLKRAARFVKNITMKQEEKELTFSFTLHLFGTTVNTIQYGEMCPDTNLWDKPVKVRWDQPAKDGLRFEQFENPGIPADSRDRGHMYLEDDGDRLVWVTRLYRPDLDKESYYVQHFLRKGSALAESGGESSRRK
jgi:hypothetical protein